MERITQQNPHQRSSAPAAAGRHRVDPRRVLGRLGEDLAAAHLERRGFAIVERNVRTRCGEIDLIAFDGCLLVFAEVKTRRLRARTRCGATDASPLTPVGALASHGPSPSSPLEGLRIAQRARVRRLALAWVQERRSPAVRARDLRFDAIGVVVDRDDRLLLLDHVEGAW